MLDIHCCSASWGGVSPEQANYIADVLGWTVQQKISALKDRGFRSFTADDDASQGGGGKGDNGLGGNALFIIFTILGSIVILAAAGGAAVTLHHKAVNKAGQGKQAVATGESAA